MEKIATLYANEKYCHRICLANFSLEKVVNKKLRFLSA